MQADWSYPTKILFGIDRLNELTRCCDKLNFTNPLIVTDSGLVNTSMFKHLCAILTEHKLSYGVFSEVKSNPEDTQLQQGITVCEKNNHDGIIAIGGGSSIDMGKAIALMFKQDLKWQDLEDIGDNYRKADKSKILPVIAIPTTSGTGSEVGRASVIVDTTLHRKVIIFHPDILPKYVIADPVLTQSMPKTLTAYTGMDALSHNLEAYCAPNFHPFSEGIALEGTRLAYENLKKAYLEPQNLTARSNMLACSMLGATAFQKGLGAMHALSHALGAVYDSHHGLLNAILMPYVLKFNFNVVKHKLTRLAAFLQLPNSSAAALIEWVESLRQELHIPNTLAEIGIDNTKQAQILELALQDPSCASNPQPLNHANLKKIFEQALSGKV